MNDKYFFSPSTATFYPERWREDYEEGGGWPTDAVEISNELVKEFHTAPPPGKVRGVSPDGMPAWLDIPGEVSEVGDHVA